MTMSDVLKERWESWYYDTRNHINFGCSYCRRTGFLLTDKTRNILLFFLHDLEQSKHWPNRLFVSWLDYETLLAEMVKELLDIIENNRYQTSRTATPASKQQTQTPEDCDTNNNTAQKDTWKLRHQNQHSTQRHPKTDPSTSKQHTKTHVDWPINIKTAHTDTWWLTHQYQNST